MRRATELFCWLFFVSAAPAAAPEPASLTSTPADAVFLALSDAVRLPVHERRHFRYLSLYHIPAEERENWVRAIAVHANSLSRKGRLVIPAVVFRGRPRRGAVPELIRLDLRDYGWPRGVYEKLAAVEPYFTVHRGTRHISARWLPREQTTALLTLLDTQIPVVRADWFWTQTVVSADRVVGYYDFLGVRNRDDFFRLVGADQKKAQAVAREWGSIIQKSGVAQHSRQVFRFGIIDGGGWFTKDVLAILGKGKNALDNLDNTYKHDAEELIFPLPNGLFGYHLNDAKGAQQKSAPDGVGPDTTATSNDGRIHAYLSCVRCHEEGLRPLRDYGRLLLTGPQALAEPDEKKRERLELLYLRPLERHRVRDIAEYTAALQEVAGPGFRPRDLAALYRELWERWYDTDVSLEQAARELGVRARELQIRLRIYATPVNEGGRGYRLPLTLLGLTREPALRVRREHFESGFDTLQLALDLTR